MSYRSHQISPAVESQTRGRRCGVIVLLVLGAGALFAVSTIAPRSAEGVVLQEPLPKIDDGLTEEEAEFINRPVSEMTPEDMKRRDKILKKMEKHLLKMMEKVEQKSKKKGLDKKSETKRPTTVRPKRPTRRPNQPPERKDAKDKEKQVEEEDVPKRPPLARPRRVYTPPGAEPPTEPEDNYRLPFDQRKYSFGLRNGNYEELVQMFERKTGLPAMGLPVKLVGARPEESLITYISAELTDFRTTLHQINDLLFYEVLPPLYLYYNADEFRLELDAFKELRFKLPPSRLFTSIEAVKLEVALGKLMASDIVRVFFRPESAADMRVFNEQVSNMFGEWVLMTTVEGTGVIDYTGRVDILEKIQDYMGIIGPMLTGEAELTILPVEYIEPSEALDKLMLLVPNLIVSPSEGNFRGRRAGRGRNVKDDPSTSEAQKILVIPDDDYDVLLVRGLPYKVTEVKRILEFIDRPPADKDLPEPVVVKLRHAQAEAVADTLDDLINGGRRGRAARTPKRPKKGETPRIGSTSADELRIYAIVRTNSLFLLGPKDLIEHAKYIITEKLDVEVETKYRIVPVEKGNPEQIIATVESLLTPPGKRAGDRSAKTVNMEVLGNKIYISGEPAMMSVAEQLIRQLDGDTTESERVFVYRLKNAKPSEVVNYLRLIVVPGAAAPPKGKRASRTTGRTARFFDDDATGRVFFHGSPREWEDKILPLIELFDEARDEESGGSIEFVELKFADPNNVVSTLNSVYGSTKRGKPDKDGPQFIPTPRGVIITGTVSGSEIKHIRQMIDLMDPDLDDFERRTFMLTNVEPEEVEDAIMSLFIAPTSGGARRPGKGSTPAPAQTIRMAIISGGIIVNAPKEDMPKLAKFIEQLDSDGSSPKFVRRNFDLEHADPQVVQDAIDNLFSVSGAAKGKRRPQTGALDRNTIRTSVSARSIIVFAAEERFAEIEEVIQTLDRPAAEDGIVTRRFEMVYADAEVVADQIEPMLEIKMAEMQSRAGGKVKGRGGPTSLSVLANTKSNSIWITAPLSIVEYAAELVPELDREESEIETIYKIYDCVNARADDLADLLNMLYGGGGIKSSRRSGDKKKDASARQRDRILRRLEGGPEDLNIVALPGNQALSISGPRKKVEEALVRAIEIDHKSQPIEPFTKTFTLLWADVNDVADGIIEMLGDKGRGGARKASDDLDLWDFETGPRRAGDISVWPRYETSSLIVHAPADKMMLIEDFIGECELLANPGNTDLPVRDEPFVFYRPKYLGAYEIVSMTRTVISTVYTNSLPVDLDYLDRNTVVLKGTRRYFDDVLDLITKYVDTKENAGAVEPVTSFLSPVPGNMHAAQVIGMVSRILTDLDVEMQDVSGMTGALLGDNIPEIPVGPE